MSSRKVIKTSNAPDPVGPYNQAIKAGDFIYCSGQIAIDPVSNKINCLGNIEKETTQVLKNLLAVLNAGGAKMEDVIKTTIYLTDLKNFKTRNIIANPNCSTIQLVVALKPLHELSKIKSVIVSTYQSVSGAGKAAMDELFDQTKNMFSDEIKDNVNSV